MRSLVYLVTMSAKNSFLELRRKPGKLVAYLAVIALIVFTLFIGHSNSGGVDSIAPMYWLEGILFLLLCLFAGGAIHSGLSSGNTFFEMSDVNLLFVSPLSPRSILLYGITKLMKTALLSVLFVLFQGSTLSNFGVYAGGMGVLFGCLALAIAVLTILSLLLYSRTNGNVLRKRVVRAAVLLLAAPLVCMTVLQLVATRDLWQTLAWAAQSPLLRGIPVVGWMTAGTGALLAGDLAVGLGFLGATLALGIVAGLMIMLGHADYYEDVLCATETAFEKKRAMAEGNVHAATGANITRNIKISKTGLGGQGAAAFLYKHLRESMRTNRFGIIGLPTVLMAAGAAVLSAIMPDVAGGLTLLGTFMWMQIFMVSTGQGVRETFSHYIYLVPESAFSKLVWANMEKMVKTLVESALIFIPSGLIAGNDVLQILALAAAYALFVFLLLGINFASMRWTGADLSSGLLIILYILAVLVLLAPGLLGGIVAGVMLGGTWGVTVGVLILAGWEALVGLAAFWVSRGILHDCDIQMLKTAGNS